MTTYVNAFKKTIKDRTFISEIWRAIVYSGGDIIVAVFITAITLVAMVNMFGYETAAQFSTAYIAVNFLLTMRRVVQRVDYHWTVDELATHYLRDIQDIKDAINRIEKGDSQ